MESSRDQIEEIRNRLDVVDVIGKYVQLKQAGKNYSGKCPFHVEKTPSFIVSPELQRYKCFGCGESGDIFTFIQKIENIDFPETLEKLAKEAGVTLQKKKGNTQFQRLEEINEKAAIFFYRQIKSDNYKEVLTYVKDRGIDNESIKKFGIGYSPGGVELLNFLQQETKYSRNELLSSGLFVEKEGKLRGKFYKRVMFPIRSTSGKVIAFTGRVLPGNEYGPKYMNSPETPIYHKKDNLYGQYESRQQARKDDLIIICEGTTDVISAHQIGIKNIVAPLGTALTKEQLEKISKLTKNVMFLFDSDLPGQKALERAFILAQELSLNTYASSTNPYKDVDEMIRENPKGFKRLVNKRIDAYTYLLTQYISDKDLNRYEEYQKTVTWVKTLLSHVKSRSNLLFYVKKAYNITQIDAFKNYSKNEVSRDGTPCEEGTPKKVEREAFFLESVLFQKNFKNIHKFELKFFHDEKVKEILSFIIKYPNSSREDILKNFENDSILKELIENSIFSFSKEDSDIDELEGIYNSIVKEYFQREEREYGIRIASAEEIGDVKESERLFKEFQDLTKEKQKYEQNSGL